MTSTTAPDQPHRTCGVVLTGSLCQTRPGQMKELDETTLAKAKRGDQRALRILIETYETRVWAVVNRMLVGRPEPVEDIAQETFFKVLRALPDFEASGPARLSTWIMTIAVRTCIDATRKRVVAPLADAHAVCAEPSTPALLDPEQAAAQRELGAQVRAAIGRLDESSRAVLVLRAYHELSYEEIAGALDLEVGTVKSKLNRARAALRRAFARMERRP